MSEIPVKYTFVHYPDNHFHELTAEDGAYIDLTHGSSWGYPDKCKITVILLNNHLDHRVPLPHISRIDIIREMVLVCSRLKNYRRERVDEEPGVFRVTECAWAEKFDIN